MQKWPSCPGPLSHLLEGCACGSTDSRGDKGNERRPVRAAGWGGGESHDRHLFFFLHQLGALHARAVESCMLTENKRPGVARCVAADFFTSQGLLVASVRWAHAHVPCALSREPGGWGRYIYLPSESVDHLTHKVYSRLIFQIFACCPKSLLFQKAFLD